LIHFALQKEKQEKEDSRASASVDFAF
jgi:hypothetical protein